MLKRSVLKYIDHEEKEIARGAGIGNDCALFASCQGAATGTCSISIGGKDKIRHAIYAAANNLAASGQQTKHLLMTLTLPERAREIKLKEMMEEAAEICKQNGWSIVGGHTEVSVNVTEIIATVTALSTDIEERKIGNLTGHDILVSGYIGMEAAGLIAAKKEEELLARFPKWLVEDLCGYREHVSVLKAAEIARTYGATLMHDIGEGGIFAALWELAQRAQTGLTVNIKQIPMKQSVVELCNFYDINPYEVWSQGCLLSVVQDGEQLVSALEQQGIPAAVIGTLTDSNDKVIENGEEVRYLDLPKPDQIRNIL